MVCTLRCMDNDYIYTFIFRDGQRGVGNSVNDAIKSALGVSPAFQVKLGEWIFDPEKTTYLKSCDVFIVLQEAETEELLGKLYV